MAKQIHTNSLMMALGQIPVPEHLYAPKTNEAILNEVKEYRNTIELARDLRKKLRTDIRMALIEDSNVHYKSFYQKFLDANLIPKRVDDQLLSLNGFTKYVIRCQQDLASGISDEMVINMYQSGNSMNEISRKTGLSCMNIKDRLDCHQIYRGR